MNIRSTVASGLLAASLLAMGPVRAAPDVAFQSIPFAGVVQETYPNISADGRYVSFKLSQPNGTTLYVQDLTTGQQVQANLTLTGAPAPSDANCNAPSMNATGRYVVFYCNARSMGGTTTGGLAYFVYDRETNSTQMIPDTGDDQAGNIGTGISADGRFVAFRTQPRNGGNIGKIYVRDLVNKTTSLTNAKMAQVSNSRLSISKDGRYVAYTGRDTAPYLNVSVYDRVTGVTEAMDVRLDGSRSTVSTSEVTMSEDGSVVAFISTDKALATTTPLSNGVYVRDRRAGKTEMISNVVNSLVAYAGISGNGRYVGYILQDGLTYVYDRTTKITRKIVQSGVQPYGAPRFSTDGRYVVFSARDGQARGSITIADLGVAPGVILSANQLTLTEGGNAGTYTLSLTQAPDADVKIGAGTGAQLSLARKELTFTGTNWSTPQVISVQAVADGVAEGKHTATIVHTIASDDPGYSVVQPAEVTVTITDGIIPTIVIPATSWTKAELPLTGTAAPGSTVLVTASNRSTGWMAAVSVVADAQGNWNYTLSGYTDGVIDLDAQADGVKSVVRTVTVKLTVAPPTPTYIDVTGYIRTTAYGLAYNRSTGKYAGNFVMTNTGSIKLTGPLHLVLKDLTSGVSLVNATGTHEGAPYITVQGDLEPDGSVTIPLIVDNPAKVGVNYAAKIYSGTF
jgi:Tol biopolymer transport system component